MSSLGSADIASVQRALQVLNEAGFAVVGVGDVNSDGRTGRTTWTMTVVKPPARRDNGGNIDSPTAGDDGTDQEVGDDPDERDDRDHEPDQDEIDERDESEGDENNGGCREMATTTAEGDDADQDDVDESDEQSDGFNDPKFFTARDYGIVLSSVQKHFDSDRVTVQDAPHGAELVPGDGPEGPDYLVGESQIQLGNPGRSVIGAEPGDEVRAVPDGHVVRLELVDDADSQDEGPEIDVDDIPDFYGVTIAVESRGNDNRDVEALDIVEAIAGAENIYQLQKDLGVDKDAAEGLLHKLDLYERFQAEAPLRAGVVRETIATFLQVES